MKLSVYRAAVAAVREDFNATRRHGIERSRSSRIAMAHTDALRREAMRVLLEDAGITERDVWSPRRAEVQRRILQSVDRSAGVDWSKVYEA